VGELWDSIRNNLFHSLEALGSKPDALLRAYGVRAAEDEMSSRALIGIGIGTAALLGAGGALHAVNSRHHQGQTRRAGPVYGSHMGLMAGGAALALGANFKTATGAFLAASVLGQTAKDVSRRRADPRSAVARNLITGAVGVAVANQARAGLPHLIGLASLKEHLARNVPFMKNATGEDLVRILQKSPAVRRLMSVDGLSLMVGAAAIPIAHSVIVRALARSSRRKPGAEHSALLPTLQTNQAGNTGGQVFTGQTMASVKPTADLQVRGSLGTWYDVNAARQGLY
jgi:hypothetical protein